MPTPHEGEPAPAPPSAGGSPPDAEAQDAGRDAELRILRSSARTRHRDSGDEPQRGGT